MHKRCQNPDAARELSYSSYLQRVVDEGDCGTIAATFLIAGADAELSTPVSKHRRLLYLKPNGTEHGVNAIPGNLNINAEPCKRRGAHTGRRDGLSSTWAASGLVNV